MKHKLTVKANAQGLSQVMLDDKDISDAVKAVGFNTSDEAEGDITEVTLVMQVDQFEIETDVNDEKLRMVAHQRVKGDDDGQEYGHPGDHLKGID